MKKLLIVFLLLSSSALAQWSRTNRPPAVALYNAVVAAAGCPVTNVMLPSPDQTTWFATYDPSCTPTQIAAGNAAIVAFVPQ